MKSLFFIILVILFVAVNVVLPNPIPARTGMVYDPLAWTKNKRDPARKGAVYDPLTWRKNKRNPREAFDMPNILIELCIIINL
ncbi:hypothetical protein Glove_153g57 [Diversispora epigaea]|uniref:Uncharacterized protein n=1 Tax=Diversispora epigaea TaxID=1348612 RepID=A0A397J270_9GLOM|nr:hypothetical protein Glove_153g57 [Diversispora epigaea]